MAPKLSDRLKDSKKTAPTWRIPKRWVCAGCGAKTVTNNRMLPNGWWHYFGKAYCPKCKIKQNGYL